MDMWNVQGNSISFQSIAKTAPTPYPSPRGGVKCRVLRTLYPPDAPLTLF